MIPTNAARKKLLLAFEKAGAGCCMFEALRGVGPTFRGACIHWTEKQAALTPRVRKEILMLKQKNNLEFLL